MTRKLKEVFQGLMVGALIAAWFLTGATFGLKQNQPQLNTVTIHKQDRLSLPCDQEGAQ